MMVRSTFSWRLLFLDDAPRYACLDSTTDVLAIGSLQNSLVL